MKSVTIGTAGHIDHGKSALVAALTGKDPDRLPEEKRRGITIDLGFADLDLGDVRIGFVDVPGHERFVKNMLAGAHGIDAVALVIAADEGVMPQTREHFDICRLLGIKTGLIVITKTDNAEAELVELVRDEAQELVKGSFLEGAPIISVSAKTGSGMDQLKSVLRETAARVPERSADFVPRLPVDRVFSVKGFGAVITGTLISGEIAEGSELELLPAALPVRARGIQVHGNSVSRAYAGQRTAINLGGIERSAIERGMVLAPPKRLRATQILDVRIDVLPDALRALRSRARVRLHMHAAEVLGRIRVLNESGLIEPGASGFAQLRVESPVIAAAGERFILRSYSPSLTIAGGEVLDPFATKHRGRDFSTVQERLATLSKHDRVSQIATFLRIAGDVGLRLPDLAARTGWNDKALKESIDLAVSSAGVVACEGAFIDPENFAGLCERTLAGVKAHHKREPLARGIARETLRERFFAHAPPEIFRAVLAKLEADGQLVSERDVVRARDHTLEVTGADAEIRAKLAQLYAEAGLEPPSLDDALQRSGVVKTQLAHGRKLLQLLIGDSTIIRIQGDLFFHAAALEELRQKLRKFGDEHEPDRLIDVANFKELAGVSRKYAIPLLEYFDREKITRRAGDKRVINK